MARTTHREWLARHFRPLFGGTAPQPRGRPGAPPTRTWVLVGHANWHVLVTAATRSEARAAVKRRLGYRRRLPKGCRVVELVEGEP